MKKLLTFALFLALAVPVFAFDFNIHACTADDHSALLTLDILDGTSKEVTVDIRDVFSKVAKSLTADQLVSGEGFRAFITALSDEDKDAIQGIQGPPVIGDVCE